MAILNHIHRKNSAITVRPLKGQQGKYEIIAGEHRMKAAQETGQTDIPAHILYNCDDEKAREYFTLTNLIRRELSLSDKIYGWWTYKQATKYARSEKKEQLIRDKVITVDMVDYAKSNATTIKRLVKMHDLIPELIKLADAGKLHIRAAVELSYLSPEQQNDLLPHKANIDNIEIATKLRALGTNDDGSQWSEENILKILNPPKQEVKFKRYYSRVTAYLQNVIPPHLQDKTFDILSEALQLYKEKHSDQFVAPGADKDTKDS